MEVTLAETQWEILDCTDWTDRWVGISSGDIYVDAEPFGHYVAYWIPNTSEPARILITALNESLQPTVAVAFECASGEIESNLHVVDPSRVPWGSDGIMFGDVVKPSEVTTYTTAGKIVALAGEVVRQDLALYKYLCDPKFQLTEL